MKQRSTTVRKNERSWAIELISQINAITDKNDLIIKHAGGESTISRGKKRMFPDVILYGDKGLSSILQGWELKMPNVPITNNIFIQDAQRKAKALELNSFIIWNFTYARLYIIDKSTKDYKIAKNWDNTQIISRDDVRTYKGDWEKTLKEIILTVNDFLSNHTIKTTPIGQVISQGAIKLLINDNKIAVAGNYKNKCTKDTSIEAELNEWWKSVKNEYEFDEKDKFKAYAKNVILNWAYRIIFAHLIKKMQKSAALIDEIDFNTTPEDANKIFREITSKCDFYNVFEGIKLNTILPSKTWNSLVEFSLFLKENGINNIDQSMLQSILEGSIKTTRRELHGQFTTPEVLARILVRMTIHNREENCGDTCCGTGTIPHEILKIKKEHIDVPKAIETTWASDKYQVPLQIANISMTSYDTINLPNRLFRKNAFALSPGEKINIINPQNGTEMTVTVPEFGAICSNLPFVSSANIPNDDLKYIQKIQEKTHLDSKSDLSFFLAIHLQSLLKEGGYLGIITSNSWLGTTAGNKFYQAITNLFDLKQVHISGCGRWFENADIITTILILQKKIGKTIATEPKTSFFVWKKDIKTIDKDTEDAIVDSSLLDRSTDKAIISRSVYTSNQINALKALNLSYNALFHDVLWLLDIKDKLVPIKSLFHVFRGSRRGWDDLFFPQEENHIEKKFLMPALFNARNIRQLIAKPDREAFSCSIPLNTLETNYPGAYKWVDKFKNIKNGVGTPLPNVLKRTNEMWYEMKPNEIADVFTMMNPDARIFFGRFKKPSFINQRLIGLKVKDTGSDTVLCHALLNSILMKFFIEAVGFGRGLGVLDINKDNIENCFMLSPSQLSKESITSIKSAFSIILKKNIMTVEQELLDRDWQFFNHTILKAYNIDNYYERICNSLESLREVRATARKVRATAK